MSRRAHGFALYMPAGSGGGGGLPETPLAVIHGGTGDAALTVHALLLGAGTGNVTFVGPAAAAQILMAQGASADPIFVAVSGDATINSSGVLTLKNTGGGAAGPVGDATHVAAVTVDNQGRVTTLASVAITGLAESAITNLVADLAAKLTSSSIPNHNLVIGTGTSSPTMLAPGSSGQLFIAQGASADPQFLTVTGDGTIDGSGKLTLPVASQSKIGSLLIFGHSWVGGNRLSSTGTANFETQGLVGRLAGLLGIHNDNIQNGGISGSRMLHAVTSVGTNWSGWAYPLGLITPLDSPLAADNTATSVLSGSTNAFPAAMVIAHGINDANLYATATALPHTLVETAWSNALRTSISRMRAGALFSSYLDSTGAITWDGSLAFSAGFTNLASIAQNTGPAVRKATANGETVTFTIPTNVPANFVVALCFIGTSNSWTRITSVNMNNTDVTTPITVSNSPGQGIDFALNDVIYDPSNPTELMQITTRTSDTIWTVTRGFNGTTKTTHATNDSLVKYPAVSVNFSGSAAAATGSLVVDATGMAGGTGTTGGVTGPFGAQPLAVVKRFACTAADAGKTIVATTAGFMTSASNQAVNFDSAWIEATNPPPIVILNLPRFQFVTIGVPLTYAIIQAFNTNTASVIAEFDSAVQMADLDAVIYPRGGILANTALNNTTSGTITGVQVTANGNNAPWGTTGWVMVALNEQMLVTATSGTFPNYTISVLRGYNGSTIVAHANGADVSDATWWNTDFVHPNGFGHGVFAKVVYDAYGAMSSLPLYTHALAAGSQTQDVRAPLLGVHDNWYIEFNWNVALAVNTTFTLNTLWFVPFFVPQEVICTGIAIVTGTTTAGTGTAVRAGLYDLAADRFMPGNLIQEFGTQPTTALTTVVEVPGHKILQPGWYFAAFVNQGTTAGTVHTVTALGWTANLPHHMVASVPTTATATPFFNQTGVTGALPASAGASLVSTAMPVPWIHLRAKTYG